MNYYLGIDIGTSASKAVCYTSCGDVVSVKSISYPLYQPKPGYAEQNPEDWTNASIELIKIMSNDYSINGIGLSGQMHGLVILDKNDRILRNSIIWCDNRTSKEKKEIDEAIGKEKIKEITGNESMAAFTLAKLLWVKNNEPDIYSQINKVMLPKDYVRYVLTGEFKTEYSDASGMQIVDIKKKKYSKEILTKFNFKEEWFPLLCESVDITGYISEKITSKKIFIVGGAGDQAAAALGNGILKPTDISLVLGSSGVVFNPIMKEDINAKLPVQVFMHAVKDTYHIMGVTNGCGLSYSWYLENLAQYEKNMSESKGEKFYDFVNNEIEKTNAGANGLIYLPYLNGERVPHDDQFATGSFLGIRQTTSKNDFSRAVIEGISYSLRDCYELLQKKDYKVYISGGGAKSKIWKEILATNLKTNIYENNVTEAGTLGVAILAMVAGKEYSSIEEAIKCIIKNKSETKPNKSNYSIYDKYFMLYKQGYESLKKYYELQHKLEEMK